MFPPTFCWKTPHICSEGIKNFSCLLQLKAQRLVFLAYASTYNPLRWKRSDTVCISSSSAITETVEVRSHFNGTIITNNMQKVSPFTQREPMVHMLRNVHAGSQSKSTANTFRKIKIKQTCYVLLFSSVIYGELHTHFSWFSFVCFHEMGPCSAVGYQWLNQLFTHLSIHPP